MLLQIVMSLTLATSGAWAKAKTTDSSQTTKLATALDQAVGNAIKEKRIVGAAILVAKDGKVLYRKAHGLADREKKISMREDSLFRLASMTKTFTSVIALKLVDDGVLKLDDPVTKWLPEFKPKTQDGKTPVITLKHLLNHTSGLSYGFFQDKEGPYPKLGVADGLNDIGISLDENLKRLAQAPLFFEPGSAWQYSLSTDVLGRVIEKASKISLPEALRKYITTPLKLKDTAFWFVAPSDRIAVPYADGKPEPVRMTSTYVHPPGSNALFSPDRAFNKKAYPSGGSGAVGTLDDYFKFLEVLRNGGAPLLKSKTNEMLFTDTTGDLTVNAGGPGWGWTLAASILKDQKAAQIPLSNGSIQHGGAYGHFWWIDSKEKITTIVLTNTTYEGMSGQLPKDIRAAVYQSLQ